MAKKTGKRSFEEEFLQKRMAGLQLFIDSLSQHKELRSSLHFIKFLKTEKRADFDKIKKDLDKQMLPTSDLRTKYTKKQFEGDRALDVDQFSNTKGEIDSEVSTEMKDYAISLDELCRVSIPLYEKLEIQIEQLGTYLNQAGMVISRVGSICREIFETHDKFNQSVKFGKLEGNSQLYQDMNVILQSWKERMDKQESLIEQNMIPTISYSKKEFLVQQEVFSDSKDAENEE